MVTREEILAWMVAAGAATAADTVTRLVPLNPEWLLVGMICSLLAGLGGLAHHLMEVKFGGRAAVPRWECLIPLLQTVIPASVVGILIASAAYGYGGGTSVNPWTFFLSGICGWRTRWAIDIVVAMVERGAKVRKE